MPLIQIRIASTRPVSAVIADMQDVLARRHRRMFGRRKFLSVWGGLRDELRGTIEYINFRDEVRERAAGLCRRCGCVGCLPHHIKRVAENPELAVDPNNAEW